MTGKIMRGIGSFYTVLCDEDGLEYTLRAQKKLRHQRLTPMVGDRVRFTPGEEKIPVVLRSEQSGVMTWRTYLDGGFAGEATAVLQ